MMRNNDVTRYIEPTQESGRALVQREIPGEVVMLNLMRFRSVADYAATPNLAPPTPISGAEAYCHGAPHGIGWVEVKNLMLYRRVHELKPAELFGTDKRWIARFQGLATQALRRQGWKPQQPGDETELLNAVVNPARWTFTTSGIQIDFGSYEGGYYACTPEPVIFSWKMLKPLLLTNNRPTG